MFEIQILTLGNYFCSEDNTLCAAEENDSKFDDCPISSWYQLVRLQIIDVREQWWDKLTADGRDLFMVSATT